MELTWKKRERKGAQVEQHQCSFAGVRAKRKDAGVRRLLTLTVTWPLCLAVKCSMSIARQAGKEMDGNTVSYDRGPQPLVSGPVLDCGVIYTGARANLVSV